jgi:hypothetical protein
MREPDASRTTRAGGAVRAGDLAEGVDLLVSGGGGLAGLLRRRLVTVWARGRSVMRVRAWRAQPDARPGARWGRWLLAVGDAVLAVALAVVFYLATGVHYEDRRVGIALILLQTLPLAVRRRYPVGVLAVVVAATLAAMAAEIPGRPNGGGRLAGGAVLGGRALPAAAGGLGGHRHRGRPGLAAVDRDQWYRPDLGPALRCGGQPGFPGAGVGVRRVRQ